MCQTIFLKLKNLSHPSQKWQIKESTVTSQNYNQYAVAQVTEQPERKTFYFVAIVYVHAFFGYYFYIFLTLLAYW